MEARNGKVRADEGFGRYVGWAADRQILSLVESLDAEPAARGLGDISWRGPRRPQSPAPGRPHGRVGRGVAWAEWGERGTVPPPRATVPTRPAIFPGPAAFVVHLKGHSSVGRPPMHLSALAERLAAL